MSLSSRFPHAGAFLESLITFLLPFFLPTAPDISAARSEVLETLASYGTRTRAEMLAAVRIIAFSMTTLETLAEAKANEPSSAMKLRYCGCANSLNRSTMQITKHLDASLAREPAAQPEPIPEPASDTPPAEARDALEHAQAMIQAHRNARPPASRPAPSPSREEYNRRLWAGALSDALRELTQPNQAASSA